MGFRKKKCQFFFNIYFFIYLCGAFQAKIADIAEVAQLVEHNLAP